VGEGVSGGGGARDEGGPPRPGGGAGVRASSGGRPETTDVEPRYKFKGEERGCLTRINT